MPLMYSSTVFGRGRYLLLAVVIGAMLGGGMVAPPAAGQRLVSVFDLDIGACPLGMGGAFTALADDENALFYNPAGLAFQEDLRLGSLWGPRFGSNFGKLALAGRGLGSSVLFLFVGGIPQYDEQDRPGKALSWGNWGLIGSGALKPNGFIKAIPENIATGLSLKFLRVSTLKEGSGSGAALDWGLLLELAPPWVERVRLGLTVRNLLSLGVKYGSGYKEPWRRSIDLGISVQVTPSLLLAADLGGRGLRLGGAFRFEVPSRHGVEELTLRAGGFLRGGLGFTLGLGLHLGAFQVDYAFIAYPRALSSHYLGLSMEL